jgi:hypothetical protein
VVRTFTRIAADYPDTELVIDSRWQAATVDRKAEIRNPATPLVILEQGRGPEALRGMMVSRFVSVRVG